ncbi:hypothetical protein [Novibacillus thermophilus]|uniref:hypothetical protein n=1 Tax=Novibacillus thermophilus TaxID=1471761 RepID=UPI0014728F40|nr:hypothetical protein [Novibacillus thermophilus]
MVDVLAVAGLLIIVGYNVIIRDLGETTSLWWGWDGGEYRYHPLNVYRLVMLVPFSIWLLRRWRQLTPGHVSGWVFISVGMAYTLSSFLDFSTNDLVAGLTTEQWLGLALIVAGWGLQLLLPKKL